MDLAIFEKVKVHMLLD